MRLTIPLEVSLGALAVFACFASQAWPDSELAVPVKNCVEIAPALMHLPGEQRAGMERHFLQHQEKVQGLHPLNGAGGASPNVHDQPPENQKALIQSGVPQLDVSSTSAVSIPKPFPASLVPGEQLPRYRAVRAASTPVVDGCLDEAVWKSSRKTTPFVDLISGKKVEHETRAAMIWDNEYLYIGFWIGESNVEAKYKKRDDPIYYDNDVEVFIAGQDAYYEFEINAHATVYEGFFVWKSAYVRDRYDLDPQLRLDAPGHVLFDGVGFNNHPRGRRHAFLGYDFPDFKSAVHIDGTLNDDSDIDKGWTVELAFPWKEMESLAKGDGRALPPKPGDQWRINLFRFNKRQARRPEGDSGGWALGKHAVWDSHIPELFPIVTFTDR